MKSTKAKIPGHHLGYWPVESPCQGSEHVSLVGAVACGGPMLEAVLEDLMLGRGEGAAERGFSLTDLSLSTPHLPHHLGMGRKGEELGE